MKIMVIYDSKFGNTAHIAGAIAGALAESGEVEMRQIGDARPNDLGGLDLLVVGSPTHGFRPTPAVKAFLKAIPKQALKGVKVAAFDTRFTPAEINSHRLLATLAAAFGYAAEPIAEGLTRRGGTLIVPPEGFYVADTEGPLVEGELERAAQWANFQQKPEAGYAGGKSGKSSARTA